MGNKILKIIVFLILTGCSGQKVYVWEKPETGIYQFARDHQYCMEYGDFFPWKLPTLPSLVGMPRRRELKARWEDHNGVWASYIPHEGADPVTVNYIQRSVTVSPLIYSRCMNNMGYTQNQQLNFTSHIK